MLKFCSLYSGSSGNSFFVQSNSSKILIDAGVSCKKIVDALASINIAVEDIDGIFLTHEHTDHTQSIGTLSKKYNIPVYANIKTWQAIPNQIKKINKENVNFFQNNKKFLFKDLNILPFDIPHDAANPCGFNISKNGKKLSIATDIGHMTNDILKNLEESLFVMIEANYDPEVLKFSSYPFKLKTRIAGPQGHLSNEIAGKTISHLIGSGLKEAMLGHLSKESNFPELAYKTVVEELISNNFNENSLNLSVAQRNLHSKLVTI